MTSAEVESLKRAVSIRDVCRYHGLPIEKEKKGGPFRTRLRGNTVFVWTGKDGVDCYRAHWEAKPHDVISFVCRHLKCDFRSALAHMSVLAGARAPQPLRAQTPTGIVLRESFGKTLTAEVVEELLEALEVPVTDLSRAVVGSMTPGLLREGACQVGDTTVPTLIIGDTGYRSALIMSRVSEGPNGVMGDDTYPVGADFIGKSPAGVVLLFHSITEWVAACRFIYEHQGADWLKKSGCLIAPILHLDWNVPMHTSVVNACVNKHVIPWRSRDAVDCRQWNMLRCTLFASRLLPQSSLPDLGSMWEREADDSDNPLITFITEALSRHA